MWIECRVWVGLRTTLGALKSSPIAEMEKTANITTAWNQEKSEDSLPVREDKTIPHLSAPWKAPADSNSRLKRKSQLHLADNLRDHSKIWCTLMVISLWTPVFEQFLSNGLADFHRIFTPDRESSWLSNSMKFDIASIFMIKWLHNFERHLFSTFLLVNFSKWFQTDLIQ